MKTDSMLDVEAGFSYHPESQQMTGVVAVHTSVAGAPLAMEMTPAEAKAVGLALIEAAAAAAMGTVTFDVFMHQCRGGPDPIPMQESERLSLGFMHAVALALGGPGGLVADANGQESHEAFRAFVEAEGDAEQ